MYQVFCDDSLIYDPTIQELKITAAKVTLELNKTGSFVFTIYPSNPMINKLKKLKSIIMVYRNGDLLFRGRVLNDKKGFYKEKQVTCEGELAFLNDSIQRPFEFAGTPAELFTLLIENHNTQVEDVKRFKVGRITVTDPNDYIARSDTQYTDTLTLINSQLIETHGGYLFVRHESDGVYLDYLADFDIVNSQTIEFGKNLLDMNQTIKGENIATAVIPLGALIPADIPDLQGDEGEDTEIDVPERRLTIADVNNGLDYVYDPAAVEQYGWIFKTVLYDDVTESANLKRKGIEYLNEVVNLVVSIDLSAIDLSAMNKEISSFELGQYVRTISLPHDLDQSMLVKKLTLDLFKPSASKMTLGVTYQTFIEAQLMANDQAKTTVFQYANQTQELYRKTALINSNPEGTGIAIGERATANKFAVALPSVFRGSVQIMDTSLIPGLHESAWVPIELSEQFAGELYVRQRGKVVELRGLIRPSEAIEATSALVPVGTFPETFRPSDGLVWLCKGKGKATWTLSAGKDGTLALSEYGISTVGGVPVDAQLSINVTYTLD